MTDVKSSSLIRSSRPSLVTPALDTSTSTGPPKLLLDGGEGGVDVGAGRDVALDAEQPLGRVGRAVRDGDPVAAGGEAPGDGEADAPRPAGDEDDPTGGLAVINRPSG